MKRFLAVMFAAVLMYGFTARPAQAKLFELYGSLKTGYVTGQGFSNLAGEDSSNPNASRRPDYFELEKGGTLGFELGVEALLVDLSLAAYQFFDGGSTAGTLYELLTGMDIDIALDGGYKPRLFLRLGFNLGIAFGLHQRLDLPLDRAQTANWGLVAHGIGALQYFLTDLIYVGLEFLPGYHLFIPGGDNPTDSLSHGMQYMTFLTTGIAFEPFGSGRR